MIYTKASLFGLKCHSAWLHLKDKQSCLYVLTCMTSLIGQFIITFAFELFIEVYYIHRKVHLLSVHGLAHIQILKTLV